METTRDLICFIVILILITIVISCIIYGLCHLKSQAQKRAEKTRIERQQLIKQGKLKPEPNGHAIRL